MFISIYLVCTIAWDCICKNIIEREIHFYLKHRVSLNNSKSSKQCVSSHLVNKTRESKLPPWVSVEESAFLYDQKGIHKCSHKKEIV